MAIINTDLNIPTVNTTATYDSSKVYTCYVNPKNRHITAFVGFKGGLIGMNDGNGFPFYNITDLTEEEYNDISLSLNSTESMAFLNENNRTVHCRRIYIDLLENTFYDPTVKKIYGVNNIVKLNVKCVDENMQETSDVQTLSVKCITNNQPISINGQDPSIIKSVVNNPSDITLELLGESSCAIQIKAVLSNVDYLFLTAYPQLLKLTDNDNANLVSYLATVNAANTSLPPV
jgi:hypothetical protein